ncbi:MAG: hypothetical protein GX493_10515 [Firmicutes bacterium]|nr:hypothetical protein [Bacillota bacterium]
MRTQAERIRFPFLLGARRLIAVIRTELAGSGISYLFPLPFYLGLLLYLRISGLSTLGVKAGGLWGLLVAAGLLAMVYGLQSFAKEADRKTLDFTLSRPVPVCGLVLGKYLLSLAVLLGWTFLFAPLLRFDLTELGLSKGMGPEWILLFLLSVHAMSFLAGIISRGLERFFLVIVLSGVMGSLCYFLWKAAFDLMTANYYWFDIPPVLLGAVSRGVPYYLGFLSIVPPVALVLWHLAGRPRPWTFPPLRRTFTAWGLTGLLLGLLYLVFSPPLWPDRTAVAGDWRGDRIVYVTKGVPSDKEVLIVGKGLKEAGTLKIARLWGRTRAVYTGVNLAKPRFSPDGRLVAFVEDGWIKVIGLRDRQVTTIGRGDAAAWSHDGRRLVIARRVGKRGLSRLFLAEIGGRRKPVPLTEKTFNLADLAWDSRAGKLYLVGFFKDLSCLDLETGAVTSFSFPKGDEPSIYLGVIEPATVLDAQGGRLYLGLIDRYRLQLYALDLRAGSLDLVEEKVDRRLQTGAPLLLQPSAKAAILLRIDGSFAYQIILLEALKEGYDH